MKTSLAFRARHLFKKIIKYFCPGIFPDRATFESVAQSASAFGCELQYMMDINSTSHWHSAEFVARFGGYSPPGEERTLGRIRAGDRVRSDMLMLLLRQIIVRQVPGALAELGVHRGDSARLLHHYCPERKFYLFDTFAGFAKSDFAKESLKMGFNEEQQFTDTNVRVVLETIAPRNAHAIPIVGWFPASVTPEVAAETFAFVHLDADLEAPTAAGLDFFWPRLSPGGFIVVHDYNSWPGARLAVDRFLTQNRAAALPMSDKSGSIVLAKI